MRLALTVIASLAAGPLWAELSDADLKAGFNAMREDPAAARAALADGDQVQRDMLDWVMLRDGRDPAADLAAHLRLIEAHPEWPVDAKMQAAAEAVITDGTPDIETMAYFIGRTPRSAEGLAGYLRALTDIGAQGPMDEMLAQVWPKIRLTDAQTQSLVAQFPEQLAPHHWARADALAWDERTAEARAISPHLSAAQRAELAARLAYITNAKEAGVLDAGRGDVPSLAYARFRWLIRNGNRDRAIAEVMARPGAAAMGRADKWAHGRLRLARQVIQDNRPMIARMIAGQNDLSDDNVALRARLEWLAGYIAYKDANAPQGAVEHWERMLDGVRSPVSKSRGWFWIGQAKDRLGDEQAARAARTEAARHHVAFYGQLAAEQVQMPFDMALAGGALDEARMGHETDLLRGLDLLALTGHRGMAYSFVTHLGSVGTPDDLRSGAARLLARGEYFLALRLGKAAAGRGLMLPEAYFPLHPLVEQEGIVDPALALAIARQESEFRADAGSPAGALGLMQLMPATAAQTAKDLGLTYSRGALIHDWRFNARLGTAHLEALRAQFGDSPVLIAAAYNAGGGRVRDWIAANGDPRDPQVDPVTWIEAIPFEETRNYVMRVLEAIRPYEARLTGKPPTRSLSQMLRGAYPLIRPRARPAPQQAAAPSPLRPRARP